MSRLSKMLVQCAAFRCKRFDAASFRQTSAHLRRRTRGVGGGGDRLPCVRTTKFQQVICSFCHLINAPPPEPQINQWVPPKKGQGSHYRSMFTDLKSNGIPLPQTCSSLNLYQSHMQMEMHTHTHTHTHTNGVFVRNLATKELYQCQNLSC